MIWIGYEWQEWKASGQAQNPGHSPPSKYLIHHSWGMTEKLSSASNRKVPDTRRREVILYVKS